jgi:hypothetical protein
MTAAVVIQRQTSVLRRVYLLVAAIVAASGAALAPVSGYAASVVSPALVSPANLAVAPNGDLYIADEGRDQILVRLPDGQMRVAVGDGKEGNTGDGGLARNAEITSPSALGAAPNGTVYFVSGSRIRSVSPSGIIATIVGGSSRSGSGVGARNGAIAADVALGDEDGLAVSPTGVVYLAPYGSPSASGVYAIEHGRLVEVVSPKELSGVDPLFPAATQLSPYGIAFDPKGDLFIFTPAPYALFVRQPDGVIRYVGVAGRAQPTNPFAAYGDTLYLAGNYDIFRITPDVPKAARTPAPRAALTSSGFKGTFPDDQFLDPGGIAVTASGDLITDGNLYGTADGDGTHAVLVELSPSGKVTILGRWG